MCTGVMCAWRDEVQRQRVERRLHEERSQHRDKMEALLMAAAKKECRCVCCYDVLDGPV